MRTLSIAILGAGLAGLACARRLREAGHAVRLFDKGRAPGGRLATRRAPAGGLTLQFDHGAQYLTARGPGFAAALAQTGAMVWPEPGRMVGTPSMSALPSHLAAGLDISLARHVVALEGGAGAWFVRHHDAAMLRSDGPAHGTEPLTDGPFDAVAVTLPAPQAMPLLPASLATPLQAIGYAPCWAVMAAFAERPPLPDALRPEAGPVGWIARDSSKPGRDAALECWVVQGSPVWSRAHLENPPEAVIATLLGALPERPALLWAAAHRWRFSLVEAPLGRSCLWDAALRLGVAGDGCLGGRAEAAWDSGTALAEAMLAS